MTSYPIAIEPIQLIIRGRGWGAIPEQELPICDIDQKWDIGQFKVTYSNGQVFDSYMDKKDYRKNILIMHICSSGECDTVDMLEELCQLKYEEGYDAALEDRQE